MCYNKNKEKIYATPTLSERGVTKMTRDGQITVELTIDEVELLWDMTKNLESTCERVLRDTGSIDTLADVSRELTDARVLIKKLEDAAGWEG